MNKTLRRPILYRLNVPETMLELDQGHYSAQMQWHKRTQPQVQRQQIMMQLTIMCKKTPNELDLEK